MTVAERVNAKINLLWWDDEKLENADAELLADVYVVPPPPNEPIPVGLLAFDAGTWTFQRVIDGDPIAGSIYIDVDPAAEQRFRNERERIMLLPRPQHPALLAELDGRIEMHRDEHRGIAVLGAKIEARKWWRELEDMPAPDSSPTIAPAGPHDVPGPDVKARRNYKRMLAPKLVQSYFELIHGGEARRKTLDWRADIPFVREIMLDKGIDPDR